MIAQEVAHKYAMALFLSAKEKQVLDRIHNELTDLRTIIRSDRMLIAFLSAPHVLEEHQAKLIRDVFGSRLERLLVEFLCVLVHKHRVRFLAEIIDQFENLYEVEMGIGRATVITAVRMTDAERDTITAKLARRTGKKILLKEKVDKSILGGMIAMFDGDIVDGSVRHGLNVLRDRLAHLRVH